jgi:hypothetical protein
VVASLVRLQLDNVTVVSAAAATATASAVTATAAAAAIPCRISLPPNPSPALSNFSKPQLLNHNGSRRGAYTKIGQKRNKKSGKDDF